MAQNRLVINGYPVPSGYGGVAVRRACEIILQNPGFRQSDVLRLALGTSGLNPSTAGWITSPGPKSPATLLWDRRKEGVFRCYPNEFTSLAGSTREHLLETVVGDVRKQIKGFPANLKQGDLVRFLYKIDNTEYIGMFMGYEVRFGRGYMARNLKVEITSPEDIRQHPEAIVPQPIVSIKVLNDRGVDAFSAYNCSMKAI